MLTSYAESNDRKENKYKRGLTLRTIDSITKVRQGSKGVEINERNP